MNPYQVLQISPTATREEIRAAYRGLARRWHPDRFTEGPERDWANEKMASINAAYRSCLGGNPNAIKDGDEQAILQKISEMIDSGDITRARQMLMTLSGRSAEWNYLLGMILLHAHDVSKARIYLSIAAHQQPDNARYTQALHNAENAEHTGFLNLLKKRFSR